MKENEEKPNQKSGFDFDKAFVRYAVAGSAVLGLPLLAPAQVTTTPQTLTVNSTTTTQSLPVSFDGIATDFTLGLNYNGSYPSIYVTPGTTASFLGSAGYPTAFPSAGAVPGGSGSTFVGPGTLVYKLTKAQFDVRGEDIPPYGGNWAFANDDSWLGVLFDSNGVQYLGWAQISTQMTSGSAQSLITNSSDIESATATLESIGYELATPEPASIALLALGAAGLLLLRKRRSAVN